MNSNLFVANDKLKQDIAALDLKIASLTAENEKLEEQIEKLKYMLEIQNGENKATQPFGKKHTFCETCRLSILSTSFPIHLKSKRHLAKQSP